MDEQEDIDKRTGKPYVPSDYGHGPDCICEPCLHKVINDLTEAGLLEVYGITTDGDFLLARPEEG